MNIVKAGLVFLLVYLLVGCSRSKEIQFYTLNPLPCIKNKYIALAPNLRIGIDKIKIPAYIQKPELIVYYSKHRARLFENHEWAETLNSNITRVIQANLSLLLPGAIIETMPWWNSNFQPDYQLQVIISEFEVDIDGNSILRAEYIIYHNRKITKKRILCYRHKLAKVTPETVVTGMNTNLDLLTRDIARFFNT